MNRAQFLAELTQYLTFVTPTEREKLLTVFEEQFDSAGEDGEAALIMELGTPMSITIALKRRKENGDLSVSDLRVGVEEEAAAPDDYQTQIPGFSDKEEAPEPEPVPEAPPERPMPEPLPPDILSTEGLVSPDEFVSPRDGPAEEGSASSEMLRQAEYEEIPAISAAGAAGFVAREIPPPREKITAGRVFGATLMSVIVAAVFVLPAASGGYLVAIMAKFVIGALRTMSNLTTALWMFALGFALGAFGLLIFWFFLWAIIGLSRRLYLGKPFAYSGFRRGMKKVWKTVWVLFAVFLVLGLACGAISFGMGATPDDLFLNHVSSAILDWIFDNGFIRLFIH